MEKDQKEFIAGLVLGGVLGVVLGMMVAPNTGKQTRDLIKNRVADIKDILEDEIKDIVKRGSSKTKRIIEKVVKNRNRK